MFIFQHYLMTWPDHINLQMVYGIKILPKDDPYIAVAEKVMDAVKAVGIPGAFLVDPLPIRTSRSPLMVVFDLALLVKYVPEWFPGAGFQKQGRIWGQFLVKMNTVPFQA